MEINYLPLLQEYATLKPRNSDRILQRKSLSMSEIVELENIYNNEHPFPKALRELLYLGGEYCYGLSIYSPQQEMQEDSKEYLKECGDNSIGRPFFVIELFTEIGAFHFIYLDETEEDPIVYIAYYQYPEDDNWISSLEIRLSTLVYTGIGEVIRGNSYC
jgi:hypothetical protein